MDFIEIGGRALRFLDCDTAVVGTGAAGWNAADCLAAAGYGETLIFTEGVHMGTSRNTGSDKQTYYKLTLSGEEGDSVGEMARTLFDGGCVDGDIALAEAAGSVPAFLKLAALGVPFPTDRYGAYVGYRTDHDPRQRASSAGPLTSRLMTEALEAEARRRGVPVMDGLQVIRILKAGNRAAGLLCLDRKRAGDRAERFVAVRCSNIIYACGGPAGMYEDSVYPRGHAGASGLAFEAGAKGKNLTEWQFGLASVSPRWNVSGTYMQALPRFISTDQNGGEERDFLEETLEDRDEMLRLIFLKGYQWPFDVRKARGGSSLIDLLVYRETCLRHRRVFLDFRDNPGGRDIDWERLDPEAGEYLRRAGACFGKPIDRLKHMNAPAAAFYAERGVDLERDRLEIALCAQHNNGGLSADCWWQTDVKGLFAAGEICGTHGIVRPGGSALNAGQVGSARAARFIAAQPLRERGSKEDFAQAVEQQALERIRLGEKALESRGTPAGEILAEIRKAMSRCGGAVRNAGEIQARIEEIRRLRDRFGDEVSAPAAGDLPEVYRLWDTVNAQFVYLSAMLEYIRRGGGSRGSALYTDPAGELPREGMPEVFRARPDSAEHRGIILEAELRDGECVFSERPVRPIPREEDFFENVWKSYRQNKNIL